MRAEQSMTMRPSFDVWSLAVIAFEAVTQSPAFQSHEHALACALGNQPYPWQAADAKQPETWRNSGLKALLLPCLSRDRAQRPCASAVHRAVTELWKSSGR